MVPAERLEQSLWRLTQETKRLQEERADLKPLWDDLAATAINTRHLGPLEETAAQLLAGLKKQGECLVVVQQQLAQAREQALTAGRANAAVDEAARRAETEVRDAERYEGVSAGLQWTVQKILLQQVHEAVRQANACGPSA